MDIHGSIDWLRDENKNLTFSDEPAKIKPEQLEIIFGTDQKLHYTDPFLFFAYEFRRWTLDAELILAIGYGFGDDHINSILGQALDSASNPRERKLLAVAPFKDMSENEAISSLENILKVQNKDQIAVKQMGAGKFLSEQAIIENLNEYFPRETGTFEEM